MVALLAALGCGGEDEVTGLRRGLDQAGWLALLDSHVNEITATFHASRDMDPDWVRFTACTVNCSSFRDEAVGTAYYSHISAINEHDWDIAQAMEGAGRPAAWDHLLGRYTASTDPFERVAFLAVLLHSRGLKRPLSLDVVTQAFDGSAVEQALVLEMHRTVPPPPMVAEHFRRVGVSDTASLGLRNKVVAALGHESTATALLDVYHFYATRGLIERGTAMHLGNGLGRCGAPCATAVSELLHSGDPWGRQTAYLAAARDRTGSLRSLQSTFDSSLLSSEELLYFERGLGRSD